MSGKYPTPVVRDGKWEVDLRAWGFGWHYVLAPASLPQIDAVHLAWAKLEELRAARLAEPHAQLELRSAPAARTFSDAIDAWSALKRYATAGGKDWGDKYRDLLKRELGTYELREFQGHRGEQRLAAYLGSLEALKLGPRTIRNRFSIVVQVLRFAAGRQWLDGVARMPELPSVPEPRYEWIDEPTFRAVRARIFESPTSRRLLAMHLRRAGCRESAEIVIARRKVYLSCLFYLGLHPEDAGTFRDEHVFLDTDCYLRRNTKSARCVPEEQFETPEPMADDLRELLGVLGREAFYCGEVITGGPWQDSSRSEILQRAQRQLDIPGAPLTAQILRRSYAREMFRRNYKVREVADRMGHVDEAMLRRVYARTPRPIGRARSRWTRTPLAGAPTTHAGARVVQFRPVEVSDDA